MLGKPDFLKTRTGLALAALALLCLVGFVHLAFLNVHSLWNNEFITLKVLTLDYRDIVVERLHRNHMPLYFLVLKAWTSVAGDGEIALHLPSAVFSLLGIVFVWRLGVHLFGPRMGLFVLAMAGLCQAPLELSNDARMYSWLYAACAGSLWAYIRYLDSGHARHLAVLALCGLLGISVQMIYLFVPLTILIHLWSRGRGSTPPRWKAVAALLAPILMTMPFILWWTAVQDKIGHAPVWREFEPYDALRQLGVTFMGDSEYIDTHAAIYLSRLVFFIIMVLALRKLWRDRQARKRPVTSGGDRAPEAVSRHLGLLLLWCLVPTALIAISAVRSTQQLVGSWRYYIMAGAAAPIITAEVCLMLGNRGHIRWMRGLMAAVLLLIGVNTVGYLTAPGPGLREIIHYIGEHRQPGDTIVTSRKKSRTLAFVYYGLLKKEPDEFPPELAEQSDTIIAWVDGVVDGAPRLWAVYYDGLRNDLSKALMKHPERYTPQGEPVKVGETAVQLFTIRQGN